MRPGNTPHRHFVTLAVNENLQPTPDIKSTLLDEDFWSMIEQSTSVLKPIAESIFKLEGNEFNIHKVFMVLRNLKSKLEFVLPRITMLDDDSKENIKTYIEKRVKQCIKPIHYAAYMFDPKSAGIELNQAEETEAMELIYNLAEHCNIDCLADLAKYKAKEGLWSKPFTWKAAEKVNPILWCEHTVPERSDMEDTDDDMLHDAAMEGHMQEDM
ncbi:unnamed protein product [Parnassius apollo]|uniref:(apollo) hypothetical protein n=1 Tax=Parnassius apollo TaxID=110799 RepID=A0A8S3WFS0_PARAO|nr:unnamed protein product [Parnassius apollo]